MAFRPDLPSDFSFVELYVFALRELGPDPSTVRIAGPKRGEKLGRKATHVRHLLRELAVYADWKSGVCFPGQERLAEALAVSRDSVSASAHDARDVGWLEIGKRRPGRRQGRDWAVNRYRLVLPPEARKAALELAGLEHPGKSRHPNGAAESDETTGEDEHPGKSRQAQAGGRRVFQEGRRLSTRGRRLSTSSTPGKADTNSSEHISEPMKELSSHARARQEDSHEGRELVPDDWKPPSELGNLTTLEETLTDDERMWVGRILRTEAGVPGILSPDRDFHLGWLPPPRLRELQYRVAARNGDGS